MKIDDSDKNGNGEATEEEIAGRSDLISLLVIVWLSESRESFWNSNLSAISSMSQFSLKRLFVSVTLIVVGLACLLWFREWSVELRPELGRGPKNLAWHAFAILSLSAACINFAMLTPVIKRKPWE